jgi:pyridoxal phosphate enzyme (YggS family)
MVLKLDNGVCGEIMKNHVDEIVKKIEAAKIRSGRNNEDILLIAVSKTQAYNRLLEAQSLGLNTFGENKVQELIEKYPLINGASWHFIGHLQKNKVKYIIDKIDLIHSVDSIDLAKEIDKRAGAIGKKVHILIQVNIGKETSKSGIFEEDSLQFLKEISEFDNLIVNGFMTVPPINTDEVTTRNYFKNMKNIFTNAKNLNYNNFDIKYLSMGMTDDFEIAIEEGANIVRIGSGIFGKRVYKEE